MDEKHLTPAQKQQVIEDEKAAQERADKAAQAHAADEKAEARADIIQARVDAAGRPLPPPPLNETPAQKQDRLHKEETLREQARAAGKLPAAKGEEPRPPANWVPDLIDPAYPPWHELNRGNAGYKPGFQGVVPSKEATAALKLMATGDLKIPTGCYDNVTGNPAFNDPGVLNPPWRWDVTGRQTQWVRP